MKYARRLIVLKGASEVMEMRTLRVLAMIVLISWQMLIGCDEVRSGPDADEIVDDADDVDMPPDAEGSDGDCDEEDAARRVEEGNWSIGGNNLRYRIVGEGPVVVLLHGGPGGNMLGWTPIEELADAYRLVMYDQRGSGESERLPLSFDNQDRSLMSVDRHVADLDEIRELLELDRLVLVGHSWGATLATFYAAAHPDRVERLVLYSGGPVTAELSEQQRTEQYRRLTPEQLEAVEALNAELTANISSWSQEQLDLWFVEMAGLMFPTMVCDPESGTTEEVGRGGFWANVLSNSYVDTFDYDGFAPSLSLVEAPTLITYGRCEPAPIQRELFLRDTLPSSTMVVFEQSGHQALFEEHELFMETLRAFLAGEPLPMEPYLGNG